MKWAIYCNFYTQNMMNIFWMLTYRCFRFNWKSPLVQCFIQSLLFFHKYGWVDVAVTNCMSKFSMFVPTNAIVKLSNGNMVHAQVIAIILCCFPYCSIIYPVGPVYYFRGYPYNTISSGSLKFYIGFQTFTSEPLDNCDLVQNQGRSLRSPYQNQNNINYLQIKIVKFNAHRDRNIVVSTVCSL